jgi:uncharacterized protein
VIVPRSRHFRWRKLCVLLVLAGMMAFNSVAWMQAWAMTHYLPAGERTPKPEALSLTQKVGAVLTGVRVTRPQNLHTPESVGLSYQVHHVSVGEGELLEAWFVRHPGARGIILMFPGYAESKESLLAPAVALHEMEYDVLLVDLRGAGGSSGQDTTLGVREAKDVAAATVYARSTWPGRPVVLYGVSMGGAAVLRAVAVEGVEPDGVILEGPFDRLLGTVRNRFHAMGLPAFPGAELLVLWGSVQQGSNGFAHNPVDYARSVQCPALLMHGALDPRVTPEEAAAIFDRLSGHKEFVSFPGAGHGSLFTAEPEVWKEQVRGFLETLDTNMGAVPQLEVMAFSDEFLQE